MLLKEKNVFAIEHLDCVQCCRNLGIYFSASGIFNHGQQDILIKHERHILN